MFKELRGSNDVYVIAEVGQNHQGDLDLAREYISVFAHEGANAIKFQTRNNRFLFSDEAYNAPYDSENAFASTYGEHREKLELKVEWLPILREECDKYGVEFMSTPFDEPSLDLLIRLDVGLLKVASFDIGNLPFLHRVGQTKKPVAISTGGGNIEQINASVEAILSYHDDIAVLHCVSEYPCDFDRLGLENIHVLSEKFPACTIGSSDHFNGILSGPVAYMQGARVFEKHVTLNRALKGTDHSFALEPEGFKRFVRDIKRVKYMLPPKPSADLGSEKVFSKLGKSVVASRDIKAGEELTIGNLSGRIFRTQHLPVRESSRILGKRVIRDLRAGEPLQHHDICW